MTRVEVTGDVVTRVVVTGDVVTGDVATGAAVTGGRKESALFTVREVRLDPGVAPVACRWLSSSQNEWNSRGEWGGGGEWNPLGEWGGGG